MTFGSTSPEAAYPRVLVVALGRINAADSSNNGLLLRSLFGDWPKQQVAQIYSSGGNGDVGFFGRYYQLGPQDRRLGRLFYRMKSRAPDVEDQASDGAPRAASLGTSALAKAASPTSWMRRMAIDTGLYELIFKPRLSKAMLDWVRAFQPDVILAQGYNLTFARFPVMLKEATGAKLAFFASDDWPTYLYSGQLGEPGALKWLVRPVVRQTTSRMFAAVDIPLAFGHPMGDEYAARYGKPFTVLSHADNPQRFVAAEPKRIHPPDTRTILAIGGFNRFRWPLVLDANEACRTLEGLGIRARVAVMSPWIEAEGLRQLKAAAYVDLLPDPGNDALPQYLKGADVLFLAEGFDQAFVDAIGLSVSSKSHLFMFSRRPIVLYAHPDTGVCKYATEHGWAKVVSRRDPQLLAEAMRQLLSDATAAGELTARAWRIACDFHRSDLNQDRFRDSLAGHATKILSRNPSPASRERGRG